MLWDVTTRAQKALVPLDLGAKELDTLWADLASTDADKALAAVEKLARSPAAIGLLRARLQPAEPVAPERLATLIADLDHPQFALREQAIKELLQVGEPARPALGQALTRGPSLEARRRIEGLLDKLDGPGSPEIWRPVRAVQALEHAGSPEARQALARLGQGAPAARLTREAQSALARLAKHVARPWPPPGAVVRRAAKMAMADDPPNSAKSCTRNRTTPRTRS